MVVLNITLEEVLSLVGGEGRESHGSLSARVYLNGAVGWLVVASRLNVDERLISPDDAFEYQSFRGL